MNDLQIIVATILGTLLILVSAWLLITRRDANQNRARFLGLEFELSTPALGVLLIGAGLLVSSAFVEYRPGGWPLWLTWSYWFTGETHDTPQSGGGTTGGQGSEPNNPQVIETNNPNITAEVLEFSRAGESARLSIRLSSKHEQGVAMLCINPAKATLFDERTEQKWKAADFSHYHPNERLRYSDDCNLYTGDQRLTYWMVFPIRQDLHTTFTALVPGLAQPVKGLRLAK